MRWIDLRPVGARALLVEQAAASGGTERLIAIQGGDRLAETLRGLGFLRHPSGDMWARPASGVTLTELAAGIPGARLADLPTQEFARRLSQRLDLASFSAGPTPAPTPAPPPAIDWAVERERADTLGVNDLGETVYEHPDFGRVVQSVSEFLREAELGPSRRFLRVRSPDDATALLGAMLRATGAFATQGAVTSSEWQAFLDVTRPAEVERADWSRGMASRLADVLLTSCFARGNVGYRQAFENASSLVRGIPALSLIRRDQPELLPYLRLPASLAFQRAVAQAAGPEGLVAIASPAPASFLGMFDVGARLVNVTPGAAADVERRLARAVVDCGRATFLAEDALPESSEAFSAVLFERPLTRGEVVDLGGYRTDRVDFAEFARLLERRKPDGFAIGLFDYLPEYVENETEDFRRWLGQRYALEGTADILASVWQRPGGGRTLALAVGERRPSLEIEPPPETWDVSTIDSDEDLWQWTSGLIATRAAIRRWHERLAEGEAAPEERTQVKYESASRAAPARASIARALQGATSVALARLQTRCAEVHGAPDVDALVARELGVPVERLPAILSAEQIDAIGLAIDAETRGRGFLLGDQMGLGKGRTLAALMARALGRGQKVLFLTERAINIPDIVRDFVDIGMWERCRPLILNRGVTALGADGSVLAASETEDERSRLLRGLSWPEGRNIVIGTYSQLSARLDDEAPETLSGVRLSSRWLREALDEDVFLVLDESHNVAQGVSNAAAALARAMSRVPFVVFSSATWAKNASNLEIYRPLLPLGVSQEQVSAMIGRGGVVMQEAFATMLAKDGRYISRQHDLSACVFEVERPSSEEAAAISAAMDRLADVLAELATLSREVETRVGRYNEALLSLLSERFGGDDARIDREMRRLEMRRVSMGAPLYEISRAFLASALAATAARRGVEALRAGEKPVFLFDRTMGAILNDVQEMMERGELAAAPDFREFLRKIAARMFRLEGQPLNALRGILEEPGWPMAAESMLDALREAHPETLPPEQVGAAIEMAMARVAMTWRGGAEDFATAAETIELRLRGALDATGGRIAAGFWDTIDAALPMTTERALRRLNRLIDRLPPLPLSAIDAIKDAVEAEGRRLAADGVLERPWVVGEITGRAIELRDGEIRRLPRLDRQAMKDGFQNGGIDALVINTAGATGIDLHPAEKYLDQRPRVMIEVQGPADIARQIQAYGRINRLGQLHPPRIVTLATGLPVEARLLAMRNAKLRRLSANVTGSRENAGVLENVPDLMNAVGDTVCQAYFAVRPDLLERMGMSVERAMAEEPQQGTEVDAIGVDDRGDNQRAASWYLARLALLPTALQERVLRELEAEYHAAIEELDARGENPLREDVIPGRVVTESRALFEGVADDAPSAFLEPVHVEKVRIVHRERPMRWQEVVERVEEAESARILEGDEAGRALAALRERRDMYFRSLAPNGEDTSFVAQARHRVHFLMDALERLAPGKTVSLLRDGEMSRAIVLRVKAPEVRDGFGPLFHPASYRVVLATPGMPRPFEVGLSTLLAFPGFTIEDGLRGPEREALRMAFTLNEGRELVEQRWMLTGNLFSAMSLNVTQKLGKLVSWRRADGGVERGVLVSKRHQDLAFLPVRVSDPDVSHRLLQFSSDARAYSTPELSHHGVRVQYRPRQNEYRLSFTKETCRRFGHLYEREAFLGWMEAARAGGFGNLFEEKTGLYWVTMPASEEGLSAVNRLFAVLAEEGHSFYFASRYREHANNLAVRMARERAAQEWVENGPPVPDRRVA